MSHAVCITTRGNDHLLEESLRSAFAAFPHEEPGSFVIVSADAPGSAAARALEAFRAAHPREVRLEFEPGCTRGEGRARAFELAKESGAGFVIQSVDTDMVYHPNLRDALAMYHEFYAGKGVFMQVVGWNVTDVATMDALGGWKEGWQVLEDRWVWRRAIEQGRLVYVLLDYTEHVRAPHRRNWLRNKLRYYQYRFYEMRAPDKMRIEDHEVPRPQGEALARYERLRAELEAYWAKTPRRHLVE